MATLLSNLVYNLTERTHKIKRKVCGFLLEYERVKGNSIKYKLLSCNKDYSNKNDEELKKRFKNTLSFLIMNDINKSISLLRKSIYPYEYMDNSEKFNEVSLHEDKVNHLEKDKIDVGSRKEDHKVLIKK